MRGPEIALAFFARGEADRAAEIAEKMGRSAQQNEQTERFHAPQLHTPATGSVKKASHFRRGTIADVWGSAASLPAKQFGERSFR
jgi:hypothetical protein